MACCTKRKKQIFIKQVKGFMRSMWLNIKSGFKHVTHEEYEDRLMVCHSCPFLNHKETQCTDCGCYVKVKARLKVEDCPQGYWKRLK